MWYIPEYIDPNSVDQTWQPPSLSKPYIYHFLSQHTNTDSKRISVGVSGVTYTVPGATENQIIFDFRVQAIPVMHRWTIPEYVDQNSIDFTWHPNAFDPPYVYHFASQWQTSSGVTYTVPGATEIKFVKDFTVKSVYKGIQKINHSTQKTPAPGSTQIFYMDFLNPESIKQFQQLQTFYPDIKKTRYVDSHLNVFKRIISSATTEFVWIISSICDYKKFDFSWHPDLGQREMIHCFASNSQKRGDTFYIHVDSFKNQLYNLEILDWFNVINYVDQISVSRFASPVHNYIGDNLVEEIKNYKFTTPYAIFTNQEDCYPYFTPCLWAEKDRTIQFFTGSKAISAIPRDAKAYIKTQVYDYPYLAESEYNRLYFAEHPLDIVYISNGEPNEQEYWDHLNNIIHTRKYPVKIHWVKGINGRDAAYKEAARQSTTPWFFAVFAKLRIEPNFDFRWQPDYFQKPKHYIFHALNPLNRLEYGHQAMIAYNKKLTLETTETGLDFTLSSAHEVVPILSGIAEFNQDPWMTWRTAFREVIKLKHFSVTESTVETEYRLKKWLTVAQGQYADYCLQGAKDAVEYYNSVNGDFDKLKLSYEWAWLSEYFDAKY